MFFLKPVVKDNSYVSYIPPARNSSAL